MRMWLLKFFIKNRVFMMLIENVELIRAEFGITTGLVGAAI